MKPQLGLIWHLREVKKARIASTEDYTVIYGKRCLRYWKFIEKNEWYVWLEEFYTLHFCVINKFSKMHKRK